VTKGKVAGIIFDMDGENMKLREDLKYTLQTIA